MSLTAYELKRLHMAADRGVEERKAVGAAVAEDVIAREHLYVYLVKFAGVSERSFSALVDAGFGSLGAVRNATDDELTAVKGIGAATLEQIRDTIA